MKSFLQYLLEQNTEASDHPDFVSSSTNENGSTTHTYHDKTTGVQSYIHTKDNTAYWGFTVPDNDGNATDVAPPNVSKELRRERLDTAFEHLADFAKRNPNIENISYQTNEGERGEKNHEIFQAKWPIYQENHGISTNLVRVENRPFE